MSKAAEARIDCTHRFRSLKAELKLIIDRLNDEAMEE